MTVRLLTFAAFCLAGPLRAQDSLYQARHQEAQGRQILAIYMGATDCAPCVFPPVKAAVNRAWFLLEKQAVASGAAFANMGIVLDEDVDAGTALLRPLSQFDEIAIGSGWINHGADQYIWRDSTGVPGIPQLLVVERGVNATDGKSQWSVSPYRVLTRIVGGDPIQAWVAKGAPLTAGTVR